MEEGLGREGVPYKLVGGVKFYERAEVKDIIAYLRIVSNPYDDFSIKRVINKPKRGLGKVALGKIENAAYENRSSIYDILVDEEKLKGLVSKKSFEELKKFVEGIERLREVKEEASYNVIEEFESIFQLKKF